MFVPNNMEERLRHVHVNGKKESVHNMMDQMEIAFPNLGIDLKYVPKGFTILETLQLPFTEFVLRSQ